jgi:type VI secretion system protein ImpC
VTSALTTVGLIERLDAPTVALAEAVSLAVRVEPELLRKMRLELFPATNAGLEADLWFSPLIESRAQSGIVFQQGLAQLLRQRLAEKIERLEAAWRVTESVHRYVSPAILAEEKLAYLALAGKYDEMRELLRSVVATLVSPRGRRLAGWAARAIGRLPEEAKSSEEAQMLAFGTSLRLGDVGLRNVSAGQTAEWAGWLSPGDLETVAVGVALLEEAVEFGPVGRTLSHRLELPKTSPVMLELGWNDGTQERSERIIVEPQNVKIVEIGPGVAQIDIRTVLGDSYWLTVPEPRERQSTQKKIARVRPPRVQITYDVELGGAIERKELPFVVGVLADLSGVPETSLPPLKGRKFVEITPVNFDDVLAAFNPRLSFPVDRTLEEDGGQIRVELGFRGIDDFGPAQVARQVGPLRDLLEARTRIGTFQSLVSRDEKLQHMIREALTSSGTTELSESSQAETGSQFDRISRVVEAASSLERTGVQELVTAFVDNVNLLSAANDLHAAISVGIAEIDSRLSRQLREILHHPEFLALESTWRGLHYLLMQTEVSELLKIRVLNVKKTELFNDLMEAPEFRESAAFRKIYEEEYGVFGGEPFGLLVGAYEFRESDDDVEMLQSLSQIAATSHAPFLAGASPGILQLDSFASLGRVANVYETFESSEYSRWRQFRESDDSRYIGLVLPHILLRLPYDKTTAPVVEFDFQEFTEAPHHMELLWGNAAFALAARVTGSFAHYGWCVAIQGVEGGGLVEGLPIATFAANGDNILKASTDVAITDRREVDLSRIGFIPLVQGRSVELPAFFSVNSVYRPGQYESSAATEASRVDGQLRYVFAVSRFAHYLLCMMRDKVGSFMSREDCEQFLNRWIAKYVLQGDKESLAEKAKFPLREARIEVEEVENKRGSYRAVAYMRPHFQLEELSVSLRCVVLLPNSSKYE